MLDGTRWVFRLDQITSAAGRIADRHQHPGPGIRCLLEGTFNVQQDAEVEARDLAPGDAWWETGSDTVVAWSSPQMAAKFLRGMVLPAEWEGQGDGHLAFWTNPAARRIGNSTSIASLLCDVCAPASDFTDIQCTGPIRPMMTSQLTASRFLTALLLIAALCAPAAAQTDFPTAPVRIIVPFAAGGPTDVVTRILGDLLSARWGGKPVVIENRPGAGTIVATEAIAKGTPDGTTVGMATNTFLINPAIEHSLPYDTEKDFAGVSMVATQPVALVANKSFPANTVAELVDYAKKSAEPLNYTSPGPRGVGDLAGKMLEQRAGIKMVHINYNGSAPALTDVIGGRVPIMFDIWHSAQPYVDSGDLKLIASASADRLPGAPNVATIGDP